MKTKRGIKIALISLLSLIAAAILAVCIFFLVEFIQFKIMEDKDVGLPRLYINTEGGREIESKEYYLNCTVSLNGTDEKYCIDSAAAQVRGRGNSTWEYYPKKPYRIKFNQKTSMFGEAANKSWVLLAMYNDFSYSKDRLAFFLADAMGTNGFVPSYNYVELYLNGKYEGLYLLTDQIDENSGRVDVKENFSASFTEVPFLVELDAYAADDGIEGEDYFIVNDRAYTIKYPEPDERYTQAQFDYIKSYIEAVDALCYKPGVTLAELSEYIDVDSFIDYYIICELMGQTEINWKSVYMSRAVGGKLKMGPIWDFDWSVTGPHAYFKDRDKYKDNYSDFRSFGNWFAALYSGSPEFRVALADRWSLKRPALADGLTRASADFAIIERAAKKDYLKWHWYAFYKRPKACYRDVIDWCQNRMLWLDGAFSYPNS